MLDDIDQLLRDIMVLGILPAAEDTDHWLDDHRPEPVFNLGHDVDIRQLLK
ncbi:hypothetical protein D3C75_1260440 [compost metagenome]